MTQLSHHLHRECCLQAPTEITSFERFFFFLLGELDGKGGQTAGRKQCEKKHTDKHLQYYLEQFWMPNKKLISPPKKADYAALICNQTAIKIKESTLITE